MVNHSKLLSTGKILGTKQGQMSGKIVQLGRIIPHQGKNQSCDKDAVMQIYRGS